MRTALTLSALLATATVAMAAHKPAKIPDALAADRDHYTLDYEDRDVRVLRIHYGPHAKGAMHDHPKSVTVFLTDGMLRMTLPGGKTMIGSGKAGSVVHEEAGPHQPENLSDKPFEAVRIELKK